MKDNEVMEDDFAYAMLTNQLASILREIDYLKRNDTFSEQTRGPLIDRLDDWYSSTTRARTALERQLKREGYTHDEPKK